jgi:hypothetical protein
MDNKVYFAVSEDEPVILRGTLNEDGDIVAAHDITKPVLECALIYLAHYGKQFTYEFEGAEYCLLTVKLGGNDEA